ncbi:YolA family protein [Bacillus velezensis]
MLPLHLKVPLMGYTNSTVIKAKDGRNLLYKGEANIYKNDAILGQNRVVIGWDKYIEIPMNELPSNEIQVEGLGKNENHL